MAKRRRDDELLVRLATPAAADRDSVLRGLSHEAAVLIEAAARAAEQHDHPDVEVALFESLRRVLTIDKDPGGGAAIAVLSAMRTLRLDDREGYRLALFCERTEAVFNGVEDVGASVRAAACDAVVESGDPAAALLLAGVLFERSPSPRVIDNPAARIAAARGLGIVGDVDAVSVLRVKLERSPPDVPEVLGECIGSIVRLAGHSAAEVVRRMLPGHPSEVAESAAIAVGETRLPAAVAVLRELRASLKLAGEEEAAMIGFALVRQPDATDDLLDAVGTAPRAVATAAARALHVLRHDGDITNRFTAAATASGASRELHAAFTAG